MKALRIPSILALFLSLSNPAAGQQGNLAWSLPLDDLIFSSATVDPERPVLYVGTVRNQDPDNPGGSVVAVSFKHQTPAVLWRFETGDWVDASPALSPDGTLYAGSWDGNLYALEAETGQKLWEFSTDGIIVASPALGDDGRIYFPSTDGFLYALNPDGSLHWELFIGSEMDSSPAMDTQGNLYFGTYAGELIAVDGDGQILWTFAADDSSELSARIIASPAITPGGEIAFGSGNGVFYMLDSDGQLVWQSQFTEEMDSSPVVDSASNLYFGSRSGELYMLDVEGVEQWLVPLGDIFFSSPVIDALGRIYVVAFAGGGESSVTCHAPDGTVLWTNFIPAVVDASPTITPTGLLIAGAYDGRLYAFHAGSGLNHNGWPQFGLGLTRHQNQKRPPTPDNLNRYFPYPPEIEENWHVSSWLGLFQAADWPWIFRAHWSWLYPGGPGLNRLWLYHPQLGWLWSESGVFPYAFQHTTEEWLYVHIQPGQPAWYYRFSDTPGWFQP